MTTVTLAQLDTADAAAFVQALGDIYEHAPWVAEAVVARRPFGTLAALHAAMVEAVKGATPAQRRALLEAHPDLAGKAARAGALTVESTAEQASAGLDRLSEVEYATFHRRNDAYRAKFGIPFIVCVRRHTKASILRQFERRLADDSDTEHATALSEVFRIAALRLDQRVTAPDRLPLAGRLSTHVLDNHAGRPGEGIAVALYEIDGEARRLVTRGITDHDGRTDGPLIGGRPIPIGAYELVFSLGDYFAGRGVPIADPPFLEDVPVRFAIAEPEGHYHVPLLVTPWSYTTYRGS